MSGIRGGRPRMGGHGSTPRPVAARPSVSLPKTRVLFVCIGNSCRSQMAEAFARAYGSDVIEAYSAGLSPAPIIAPLTRQVLYEKNLHIEGQFPKSLDAVMRDRFDVVVNMSGAKITLPLQGQDARLLEWTVADPIGQKQEVYRVIAAQIESLVMRLVLELRTARAKL